MGAAESSAASGVDTSASLVSPSQIYGASRKVQRVQKEHNKAAVAAYFEGEDRLKRADVRWGVVTPEPVVVLPPEPVVEVEEEPELEGLEALASGPSPTGSRRASPSPQGTMRTNRPNPTHRTSATPSPTPPARPFLEFDPRFGAAHGKPRSTLTSKAPVKGVDRQRNISSARYLDDTQLLEWIDFGSGRSYAPVVATAVPGGEPSCAVKVFAHLAVCLKSIKAARTAQAEGRDPEKAAQDAAQKAYEAAVLKAREAGW